MIDVDFDKYRYFPTLRTRQAELKGLEQLDSDRKRRLLPLLTLGRWPKALDFSKAAEKAETAMEQLPYFLDLTNDLTNLGEEQKRLRDPSQSFLEWRTFVGRYPKSIPVVQIAHGSRIRDVIKQSQEMEHSFGKLAFRIREFSSETTTVISAISALDDPRNAVVFIDCQYIRDAIAAYVTATISTINQLRSEFPELMIVVLSTSFPSSTIRFSEDSQQRGSIDILERDLHSRIGGDSVAFYGDHGSVHSVVYDDIQIMRWSARVDYPRELSWYFERRPGNQTAEGYINAAKAVVKTDPGIGSREIWGEKMIIQAADGNPFGKAPASWIAVRVNIHLARQLDFSERLAKGVNQEEGQEDFEQ